MKRFYFWLRLHSLIMTVSDVSRWCAGKIDIVAMMLGRYCLAQARKNIPDDSLIQMLPSFEETERGKD